MYYIIILEKLNFATMYCTDVTIKNEGERERDPAACRVMLRYVTQSVSAGETRLLGDSHITFFEQTLISKDVVNMTLH